MKLNSAMNSLDLSFGQELKSSYTNKSFLLLGNTICLEKIKKTAKKNIIVCSLPETEDHVNSFQVGFPSPYHLKTSGF